MTREELVTKHSNLFWYTPREQLHGVSDELLVEVILNNGTLDDYKDLMATLGAKRVSFK